MEYPINPALLIAAPILQDYFVDKDTGLPLAAGIITLYTDNTMMVLKPWFEQQGTSPPYTYVKLPNPMTLSAVGTIQDVDGNDVIPYFYPYDVTKPTPVFQSYFITVQSSDLELQFTRSNFPFVGSGGGVIPGTSSNTNENLIINNCFWRAAGPGSNMPFDPNAIMLANPQINVGGINLYNMTLAPSQHDGYTMPDIMYFKNTVDSREMISFNTFAAPSSQTTYVDNKLMMDITPELYFNINCTVAGTETYRYIQIPLSLHIKSLSGYPSGQFTIQAINNPGSPATNITVGIFQYAGTGAPSQPAISTQQILLGTDWNKSQINLPIPSAQTPVVVTGSGGDDAIFLQIGFPQAQIFNISIALPEFYLGSPPATNSFQTYDQVNAIASSPRTGDVRVSLNSFSSYGWVPANDGSIGSPSSSATSRNNTDTWPLYNLIYTSVVNTFAPVTGGRTAPGNTTTAAYADFSLNKPMFLTKALGRVLMGLPTSSSFTYANTGLLTVNDASLYYMGATVILSGLSAPGLPFTAGTVYYVIPLLPIPSLPTLPTQFALTDTYAHAIARTNVITGGTNGSTGTVSFAMGGTLGEFSHVQLEAELALHSHPGSTTTAANAFAGATQRVTFMNTASNAVNVVGVNVAPDGNSVAFNIVQPSTYMNVFLKL